MYHTDVNDEGYDETRLIVLMMMMMLLLSWWSCHSNDDDGDDDDDDARKPDSCNKTNSFSWVGMYWFFYIRSFRQNKQESNQRCLYVSGSVSAQITKTYRPILMKIHTNAF